MKETTANPAADTDPAPRISGVALYLCQALIFVTALALSAPLGFAALFAIFFPAVTNTSIWILAAWLNHRHATEQHR